MSPLTDRSVVANLLKSHNLHTNKKYGQNFLISDSILQTIIAAAQISNSDTVVEVGSGIGTLTTELARHAQRVITFEIDTSLQPILNLTLADFDNIHLIWQDFRQTNLSEILESSNFDIPNKPETGISKPDRANEQTGKRAIMDYSFVSNLPYNAGSHILDTLLKSQNPPRSITVMLQKEVAQKIVAQPPHATYLSNFFQLYGQATIVQIVPPGNFFPPPEVDSAILHVKKAPNFQLPDSRDVGIENQYTKATARPTTNHPQPITPSAFSRLLHRGFANPCKMINKAFSTDELRQADIESSQRPENLTFDDWLHLFAVVNSTPKR